ncbi:MAG: hypothetical protein IJ302_05780 [Clostridia bacterium]|nr:hypothetical protein [Clostridia bacterium]
MPYQSRYHISGGYVSLALDALSGELLELHDTRTGENFIKNSLFCEPQPFVLFCADGGKRFPPRTNQILENPALRCEILCGDSSVTVRYHHLTDGVSVYPADVSYTVTMEAEKTHWRLQLSSVAGISAVRFPCINGVYLGETWEDDALYFPDSAGRRFENPVEYVSRPMRYLQWRWQEYRYHYPMHSCCGYKNESGMYEMRGIYPGGLSMSYLDYADGTSGLYFASHGETPSLVTLGAATPGPENPCMCFFAQYEMTAEGDGAWYSPDVVVALHGGDWHEGADLYRAYKAPLLPEGSGHPAWFDTSAGLLAHYDFKYQNGGIVHTYRDIPALKAQAAEFGLKHLLFSGWHMDGFDNGFPQYEPDPELGTEAELADGCRIGEDGIHTTFYINARIANVRYKDISDRVILNRDGSQALERYGNANITFGCMCPASRGWQQEMLDIVTRAGERYCADGVYLDCLSAPARFCFSGEHGHAVDEWCRGYQHILASFAPLHMVLMGEHVCDEYGPYLSAQLTQSFFHRKNGVFPEMYRYTFPEHTLTDMLYPSKNLAMRPVFVEQNSDRLMQTAFVDGMYFWIYDLEEDNTFTRDPEQLEKLRGVIALRTLWLERFGAGIFRDTAGLRELPDGCLVRRYALEDGGILIAAANNNGSTCRVTVCCNGEMRARAYTVSCPQGIPAETEKTENGLHLTLPAEEYAVIVLRTEL